MKTIRVKASASGNIVFIGMEKDSYGFLTQVVAWKQFDGTTEAGLKLIKEKKLKGKFNNGEFFFSNDADAVELTVEGV